VIDLSDVGKRLLNAPLRMILGREFFDSGRVLIDIEPFQAATPFFQGGVKAHFPWFSMYCLIVSIGAPPHEMAQ
jgi:hypothetical protein